MKLLKWINNEEKLHNEKQVLLLNKKCFCVLSVGLKLFNAKEIPFNVLYMRISSRKILKKLNAIIILRSIFYIIIPYVINCLIVQWEEMGNH